MKFGFFVRKIVNKVVPSLGKVVVFDDRENLCYSLESEQAGLGKLLNQSNRDFEKHIKEIFNRKNVEHLIFGCVGTLEKFSLSRNIINRPLESVSCKKNAADIQLCLEATQIGALVTDVVIISNDSDFTPLIGFLKNRGVIVHIVAFSKGQSKTLRSAADKVINILPFIEKFRVKPTARMANYDDYIKQKSLELLALHADQTGKINLAFAGTVLNQELGLKNLKWSGYGSCKKYILNLNTNFRVKDDLLFINVLH